MSCFLLILISFYQNNAYYTWFLIEIQSKIATPFLPTFSQDVWK